ncbi:DUF6928 family protein [Paractinoplanes maris]|uniref:DUF6928 family protein n=1 Tax=Paractinoplanes maris TaxID=1734446 RepID=UPI00202080FE|nr:hypothetical protein [Actinoplanes maris]
MGAKTALLAFSDGDLRSALRHASPSPTGKAEALVRAIHPGHTVTHAGESTLWLSVNPRDDVTYATVLPGAELICDWRLVLDRPSDLPDHLVRAGAGRRIVMHGMHSVVDWLCFAVWEDGELVRSLSLSPDSGIIENIGEPYEFERPYWAGERAVEPDPTWDDEDPYPLPFHPLELGEEALSALFGFVIEGEPSPSDIDTTKVPVHRFTVTDPTGDEQATREAVRDQVTQSMGPPRMYQMGPDGTMHEVAIDDVFPAVSPDGERHPPPD